MNRKIICGVLFVILIVSIFVSCDVVSDGDGTSGVNDQLEVSETKALQEEHNRFIEYISNPEKILDINGEHVEGEDFYADVVDFIVGNLPENLKYTEKIYDEAKTKYKIIYTDNFEVNISNLVDPFTFNQLIIDLEGNIFLRNPDTYLCIGSLNI